MHIDAYRKKQILDERGQLKKPLKGEQPKRLKLMNRLETLAKWGDNGIMHPHTDETARKYHLAEKIVHADIMNAVKKNPGDKRIMQALFSNQVLRNRVASLMDNPEFNNFGLTISIRQIIVW